MADTGVRLGNLSGLLMQRGLAEIRPRRIDSAKAAATMVRQTTKGNRATRARILYDPETATMQGVHGFLSDLEAVSVTAPDVGTVLEDLDTPGVVSGPTVLAACGGSPLPPSEAHQAMARSLVGYRPEWQNDLLQRLDDRLGSSAQERRDLFARRRDALCVQEKPGRTHVLNLADPTAKAMARKWQAAQNQSEKDVPRPWEILEGYGFGALHIDPEEPGSTLFKTEFRFPTAAFNLDTAPDLSKRLITWLETTCGISLDEVRRIFLAVPSAAVTAYLEAELLRVSGGSLDPARFAYPDLMWGWHPILTLMEGLAGAPRPTLFVHSGGFPRVQVACIMD